MGIGGGREGRELEVKNCVLDKLYFRYPLDYMHGGQVCSGE